MDHPLGIGQPVIAADVAARNAINTVRPVLVDPARGDYRVLPIDGPPAPPVTPPVAPPVTPPLGPAPTTRLVTRFRAVPVVTGRPVTSAVITFNRAVTSVTAAGYVLKLRPSATGITDAWGMSVSEPVSLAWRMRARARS